MTVHELSRLYYLKKLIDRDTEELTTLRSKLIPGAICFDGMPHNPSQVKSITEELIPQIMAIEERIRKKLLEYTAERERIEAFIGSVKDYQIRLILSYRFVDLLTWNKVAEKIGGNNTEDSVKKMCYRALKRM